MEVIMVERLASPAEDEHLLAGELSLTALLCVSSTTEEYSCESCCREVLGLHRCEERR